MDHYKAALQAGQMSTTLEDICEHLLRVYDDRGIMLQHVKLVGVKQYGDVECLGRKCAKQGKVHGQEGHEFLDTIVMNSLVKK